jgi:cystathionine beta-lyase/cystathionine gamma-synthase
VESFFHGFHVQSPRKQWGITDALMRMSVGIEDTEDLINDLAPALEKTA